MSDPKIVNLSALPWTTWSTSERIGVEIKDPARKWARATAGWRVYRLAPGMQSTRLHRHLLQEEMFLILEGEGPLRHGERAAREPGTRPAGDPGTAPHGNPWPCVPNGRISRSGLDQGGPVTLAGLRARSC